MRYTYELEYRDGYGYHVDAVLINRTAKRARIAMYNLRTKQIEFKTVKPEKLTERTHVSPVLDKMYKDALEQEVPA